MSKKGTLNRFLNGKGFYIALGICMIAIGVSAWTALDKLDQSVSVADSSQPAASQPSVSSEESLTSTPEETSEPATAAQPEKTASATEQATAAPVAKYFVYPIAGEIIKGFSAEELQYSLTYNDMRLHTGIDIKADAGTAVKAAGDGVVLSAEQDPLLGYTVTIDHGNGIIGIYAGLSEAMTVTKGDTVTAGTNLGPLGTVVSECVDAPHLHLEFYKNDAPIDPKELLKTE